MNETVTAFDLVKQHQEKEEEGNSKRLMKWNSLLLCLVTFLYCVLVFYTYLIRYHGFATEWYIWSIYLVAVYVSIALIVNLLVFKEGL